MRETKVVSSPVTLPRTAPTAPPTSSAEENEKVYDEIWSLISAHFLYRDRLRNWITWRHKFDGSMNTREETQKAVNAMLDSLADEYTFFRDESQTEERKTLRHKNNVVDYKMMDGQIGYIHISTFNSMLCVPETRNALTDLSQSHGLILDLRDNWGGSISCTFDVFSLLCPSGKFVSMKGTTDYLDYSEEMSLTDDAAVTLTDGVATRSQRHYNMAGSKPLVVLVNENTKSAAEMLAGALRDNGRATVVGCKTYGKGIVQRVWEFPNNTSIKISSAKYYLPGGTCIHQIGLNPDLYVDSVAAIKTRNKQSMPKLRVAFKPTSHSKVANVNAHVPATIDNIAHHRTLSGAGDLEASDGKGDRQLNEAQHVLKQKLVSLAKP